MVRVLFQVRFDDIQVILRGVYSLIHSHPFALRPDSRTPSTSEGDEAATRQIKTDTPKIGESVESESNESEFSALNELEATSCFLATVLLSFLNSRVSRHITLGTKVFLEVLVDGDERSGDA